MVGSKLLPPADPTAPWFRAGAKSDRKLRLDPFRKRDQKKSEAEGHSTIAILGEKVTVHTDASGCKTLELQKSQAARQLIKE